VIIFVKLRAGKGIEIIYLLIKILLQSLADLLFSIFTDKKITRKISGISTSKIKIK